MLTGPSSRSNFRRRAKLTSIFFILSFHLEQQAWFRVSVVPVVPITFRFIIPLTWCRHRLITSSWKLSTNVSWSSSTFWALPGYQSNSWWEIQSFPLDDLCYHRQHSCLPPTQTCSYFVLYLDFPAIQLMYVLPWSITIFDVKNVVSITQPLKNYWHSDTSRHLHSSLGPRVVSNQKTDNWTMMCEFKTSSNSIACKLMNDGYILCVLDMESPF